MSLFLVLLNQRGQALAEVEADSLAAVTPAVAVASGALLEAALAPRQPSAVAAFAEHRLSAVARFGQHRLSGAHTLAAEVLADQVPHLDFIMAVLVCLLCDQTGSLAQSIVP